MVIQPFRRPEIRGRQSGVRISTLPGVDPRVRGTFATTVLRGGGDLESLREVLGHSALAITAGYLASTSESKRRAVKGVSFAEHPA